MASANPTTPTQLGYTPVGSTAGSQIVMGKDVTTTWEAVGLGAGGRPDILENIKINITQNAGGTEIKRASIVISVADLTNIMNGNPNIPSTGFEIKMREVSVCEVSNQSGETEERKMLVLASQTYAIS